MSDRYTLYYWPIPFRGHFVRYLLAHVGAQWDEPDADALVALKTAPVADQPAPFMAPPLLHDPARDLWLAQLPAILSYLAARHGIVPDDPLRVALTHKIVADANDVLEEITCNCGARMWTRGEWESFAETRLPRWLQIFETTAIAHGLGAHDGHMLGTDAPGLADLATAALWHTLADKLPVLEPLIATHAPRTLPLSRRIAGTDAIAAMRADQDARNGDVWCGGEIEASLRRVTGDSPPADR